MLKLNDFFSQLTPSDYIQILGIISSFSLSAIAIIISICTLRQNSKSIEESIRPIMQIYPLYIDGILYLVIKNNGASVAYIDEIICNHKFSHEELFYVDSEKDAFSMLQQAIFTPGYSIKCPLSGDNIANKFLSFYVRYHSSVKTYSSSFTFQPASNAPFADIYPGKRTDIKDELHEIAKQLWFLVKRSL